MSEEPVLRKLAKLNEFHFNKVKNPVLGYIPSDPAKLGATHPWNSDNVSADNIVTAPTDLNVNKTSASLMPYFIISSATSTGYSENNAIKHNASTVTPNIGVLFDTSTSDFVWENKPVDISNNNYYIQALEINGLPTIDSGNVSSALSHVKDVHIDPTNFYGETHIMTRFMQAMYIVYTLLEPDEWTKNAQTLKVRLATAGNVDTDSMYSLTEVANCSINSNGVPCSEVVNALKVFGLSWSDIRQNRDGKINLLGLRATALMYIRMCQVFILLHYLSTISGQGVKENKTKGAILLILALFKRESDALSTSASVTSDTLENLQAVYDQNRSVLNRINDSLSENKDYLVEQHNLANSESDYKQKSTIFEYSSLVVLFIIIIGAFAITKGPVDPSKKVSIAAGLLVISAVNALVVYLTYGKVVIENFYSDYSFTVRDWSNNVKTGLMEMLDQHADSLTLLLEKLKTSNVLGEVVYSTTKEANFFNNIDAQTKTAGDKLLAVNRVSNLSQRNASTRMNFYITVSMISALTVLGYVALAFSPPLQTMVIYAGGFLVLLAVLILVLELSAYVRTDGDKKYWHQPQYTA